jgi:hypothetical protein
VYALLLQPAMASDRVSPVGIPAVDEDVALLELFGEIVENLIHCRSRGDVEEDYSRGSKLRFKVLEGADLDEPGFDHVVRGVVAREADHAYALLQGLPGEVAPIRPNPITPYSLLASVIDLLLIPCSFFAFL